MRLIECGYNQRFMLQAQRTRTPSISGPDGVEGNRRLTSITAIALLVLLFVEGLTVLLGVRGQIRIHVFVGMLLLPPIALKLATTADPPNIGRPGRRTG